MNIYAVRTNQGTFHVESWNEIKVMDLMSYEGYEVISIKVIGNDSELIESYHHPRETNTKT